jgi:hypothetical protein
MKTTAALLLILSTTTCSFSQGMINFANSASTLISSGGTPMPVSGTQQFIFALFLAPSTTVSAAGITPSLTDPNFQFTDVYNTNNASLEGRLVNRLGISVGGSQGYPAGSTIDFIIRGWSVSAGATWSGALASWNNGTPLVPMYIGSSTIGDNMVLSGGGLPNLTVFGFGQYQVLGFNMVFIPEPSTLALAILGGVVSCASNHRQRHRHRLQ